MKKVLLFLFVSFIGMKSWGQLFQQQFTTTQSAITNTIQTSGTYTAASPTNGQFTGFNSTGVGATIQVTSGGKLDINRTGNGWSFVRGSAFSGPPTSLMVRFNYANVTSGGATTSAIVFAVGGGASIGTTSTSITATDAHSRLAFNSTANNGEFVVRDTKGSTNGATTFSGEKTILFVANNSGATLTYKAPDGTYETVASGKFDVWVGTSKQLDERPGDGYNGLSYFKCLSTSGTQEVTFDNMLIDPIPAAVTSSAAVGVTASSFTANWNSVSGATGYRIDVATDAAFTSLVAGYNNIYVSGQSTTSYNVTGLNASTQYYYRVRAAAKYTVDEFAGANSSSQSVTTATPVIWTGASSSWSTASNWNTNAVPTAADNVLITTAISQPIIGTGDNITVNSITIQNGTSLTLTGTGTLTSNNAITVNTGGALIGNSSNVSGTVTLQQNFVGQRGWRVLANPFTTATTIATVASGNNIALSTTPSGASGLTDSRTYDNSANVAVTAWANATASTWAANTAYALFYRGTNAEVTGNLYTSGPAGQTYSVSGTLNGATTTITPLVGDGTSFNLVGNPYAAPVNSQALTGGVAAPYTVYQISVTGTPQTKSGGWIASLTSSTSTTIPVLGVIAYVPPNTNPFNITAATDINPSGTLQTGLFGTETVIKNLELIINNSKGEYQDKLFVRIGTDKNRLSKFANDNVNFYTINSKNEHLAIDSREQLNTSIPLGINGTAGNYVLNVANNNLEDVSIYLKDKLNNTQTELTSGANYSFSITADATTKGEGRFELLFINKATATLPATTSGGFTAKLLGNVITNNQPIQVQVQNASANALIQVKDINGRAIATQAAVNGLNTINVSRASLGMYIVQTTDGNNIVTDKVIKQ
ncbi:MAG: T9SS type A sorting domain-containing protein [Bacteroidetes bacterium]|nr:T9SS type A sorting domain-containing protein [Bacteroidota bacterium]MBS1670126.1 T9SS type A sorting domain-containing protein [Bacteroidota bacterium]